MQLSEIYVYRVKSLAGFSISKSEVSPLGLKNDRMMMLVDENGVFISQRKYPQLALIKLQEKTNAELTFLSGENNSLVVNLDADFTANSVDVEVWKDRCSGYVATDPVNQWFSAFLDKQVRLVNYNLNNPRPTDPDYSIKGDAVSYADGFPLLVISQASLAELNARLDTPVSMRNFRPNLVVDGCEPFAEDDWKQIKIGEIVFDAVKRCSRCVLTTVDPDSGQKRPDAEPLKTLSQYRRGPGGVFFGMNLIPRNTGTLNLQDKVEIIA